MTPLTIQTNRARAAAMRAVGKRATVRTGPNTKVSGKIVSACFHAWRPSGRSLAAQWEILLMHDSGAPWGPFVVEELPR